MPGEPRWLTSDVVRSINRAEVEAAGADYVVLNDGYVDGACARPQFKWHYDNVTDIVTLAVALLFAVAQSHAFKDGNKRTGFYAAITFLQLNGIAVPTLDTVELAEMIISVIQRELSVDDFELAFREDLLDADDPN